MRNNVITFASILANNLSINILNKFQQSVEDKLTELSQNHNTTISLVGTNNEYLVGNTVDKYADGTLKYQNNSWDLLTQDEQDEVQELLNLQTKYREDSKKVIKYLIPLAFKTQEVNSKNEVISLDEDSYTLFFNCLPDFISQDKELLMRGSDIFSGLSEEEIYTIKNHKMDSDKITAFVETHRNLEVETILKSLYSLDFLMDF